MLALAFVRLLRHDLCDRALEVWAVYFRNTQEIIRNHKTHKLPWSIRVSVSVRIGQILDNHIVKRALLQAPVRSNGKKLNNTVVNKIVNRIVQRVIVVCSYSVNGYGILP